MLTGPIIPFPIYLLSRKMVKIFDSISAVDGLNRQKYEQRRQQNNFVGGTSTIGLSAFCRGMGAMMCCPENGNRRVYDETSDRVGLAGAMEKIQAERSKTIDLELKKEAEMNEKIIKILLLGASDSGKSTIAKQMRILHTEGFSADEKLHYKYMIHSNYIDSFQFIAKGIYLLQIDVPPAERELIHTFGDSYYGQFLNLSESSDLIGIIVKFLNFKAVKQAIDRINEFYVPDNTSYLLKEAHRILHPEYNPTTEDIIHARAATKGIYEIIFQFRQFTIRLIDVGGQKTERRKWIHCFEGVAAILFIVSLSCYNQVMEEDSQRNQMADTIELFKTIYRNKFLRSSSFMIFLNKKDIFARKILYVPLQKYYPAFETKLQPNMEAADIFKEAVDFVKNMFMTVRGHDKRPLYTHTTNATDTRNVEIVFNATYDNAVTKNLKNSGVL